MPVCPERLPGPDKGRALIVTSIDTRENDVGQHSVARPLKANPAVREELREASRAFLKTVTTMRTTMANGARGLRYPPER